MQFKGVVYGFKGYLNFGDTRHGTFTATLVALSAYVFFRLVAKGNGIWSRVLAGLSLALALWIVLSAGSRNGLLSFGIMIALSVLVLRGTQLGIKRILLLAFGSLVVVVLLGSFWNHPTVVGVRGILQDENSINEISTGRTKLWLTGIQGFLERPLTGQGGDPSLSRNFALTRVGMDNVAHNTIVEMLLQYGLLGLTMYVFLQSLIIRTYFSLKRVIYTDPMEEDGVFLIPFLSYFSLLFSSLFVSWLWSSMVWYHVSLLLAILTLYRRSLIESTEIESES
jgi:O-antigen ligase